MALLDVVESVASSTTFSGVVRVDVAGEVIVERAFGLADRAYEIPMRVDHRLAIASGTKVFTTLAVLRLVVDGALALDTTARSLLGDDLPLIADDVTVEHLLSHRSGIGDYIDEDVLDGVDDYVLTVAPHELTAAEDYLKVLDGHPTKFEAGTSFSYCNGGYVVLAILAERATGCAYPALVHDAVVGPAGLADTGFERSDERPADVAVGYLAATGLRSNVLHLPVLGAGDGGLVSTVADVHRLWDALLGGRIVPDAVVAEMSRPRSTSPASGLRYGLGLWLAAAGGALTLEGCDAGISFRSTHDPQRHVTNTVLSNTGDGAWPMTKAIAAALD